MVNRKLSRKKIVSKNSKIRTKKVGGGKLKSTKKSLSRGVNRVLAGLGSSKARARRNIRNIYEQSKTTTSQELSKLKEAIQNAKAQKKSLTKKSGEDKIVESYKALETAKKKYEAKKAQLKESAASNYASKKKDTQNTQIATIIGKAKKMPNNYQSLSTIDKRKLYEQAKKKLKSRYGGLSKLNPYLQYIIRNISKRQSKINVADEYIAKQDSKLPEEEKIEAGAEAEARVAGASASAPRTGAGADAGEPRASASARAANAGEGPGARAAKANADVEEITAAAQAKVAAAEARAVAAEEREKVAEERAEKAEAEAAAAKAELDRVKASREERTLRFEEFRV